MKSTPTSIVTIFFLCFCTVVVLGIYLYIKITDYRALRKARSWIAKRNIEVPGSPWAESPKRSTDVLFKSTSLDSSSFDHSDCELTIDEIEKGLGYDLNVGVDDSSGAQDQAAQVSRDAEKGHEKLELESKTFQESGLGGAFPTADDVGDEQDGEKSPGVAADGVETKGTSPPEHSQVSETDIVTTSPCHLATNDDPTGDSEPDFTTIRTEPEVLLLPPTTYVPAAQRRHPVSLLPGFTFPDKATDRGSLHQAYAIHVTRSIQRARMISILSPVAEETGSPLKAVQMIKAAATV